MEKENNSQIDETYLKNIPEFKILKNAKDIDIEKYDGSFKLLNEVVNAYNGLDISLLNYKDLELIYFSCIGTWKSTFENKIERINNCNLPSERKEELVNLIRDIENNTNFGIYENEHNGQKVCGMFGTGFGTFREVDKNDVKLLLEMIIKIASVNSEEECFDIVKATLTKKIKGIKTGVLSPILFCLKPTIFPILNGNEGAKYELYNKLGIKLNKPLEIENYIQNASSIREFRNKHFTWKNYRLMDKVPNMAIISYVNEDGIYTCDTGLTKNDWLSILKDKSLIDDETIELLKQWRKMPSCESSCKEIGSIIYKDNENSVAKVNGKITGRCQMICNKYNLTIYDDNQIRYFPVMMNGRRSKFEGTDVYDWILKPEVVEAMDELSIFTSKYNKESFLKEVFITSDKYDEIVRVLERKKNIILQGPPGVGKTFMAKKLAYSLIGKEDNSVIEIVQFHQSYSYEDFIYGYKPNGTSFELKPGIFYLFCEEARKHSDKDYFFIIDEINRGNLSKIFGELLMLIENDKRGKEKIRLSHNQEYFTVPKNIYIIGMMNTADRSLAIVDYALRRRFSMINIEPAFNNQMFRQHLLDKGCDNGLVDKIIDKFNELNKYIIEDKSLGDGFTIGHSYFCSAKNMDITTYKEIVEYDIKPLLKEYWFDNDKIAEQKIRDLEV